MAAPTTTNWQDASHAISRLYKDGQDHGGFGPWQVAPAAVQQSTRAHTSGVQWVDPYSGETAYAGKDTVTGALVTGP